MKNRTRNQPKIYQKSIKNLPKIGSGADLASEIVFGPISLQFWLQLGTVLGSKLASCWPKNRFLEVPEGMQKRP